MAVSVRDTSKSDYNYLLFTFLFISLFGSVFFWLKFDAQAGLIYTIITLVALIVIPVIISWISNDDTLKPLTNFAKIPVTTHSKLYMATFMFLLGSVVPYVTQGFMWAIGKLTESRVYSITSFSIPLYGSDILGRINSFSAAEAVNSMPFKLFFIKNVAGVSETYNWAYPMMFIGVLIGLLLVKFLGVKGKTSKLYAVVAIAFAFVIATFTGMHQLNNTYVWYMYIAAGIFLLISNASIMYAGVFLMFWIGYHRSNNEVWLMIENGVFEVLRGYLSWYGLIFIPLTLLIVFYTIKKKDDIIAELKRMGAFLPAMFVIILIVAASVFSSIVWFTSSVLN